MLGAIAVATDGEIDRWTRLRWADSLIELGVARWGEHQMGW
jgi:hypothetical protein